ncbi:hypothetical protein BCR34DRAFT_51250 [Clohesyomyces aquaticus]|uniref:Zn(2)-C6 fungal-type domain-containing protein n=1 Tax=Clohesyomyces aquaticus TaxID=1231657 RepID=A0A1Y2A452_9PLEO|nr:hypothetical protein BCR34DRAFT_51250 [Clohesyomyces aquaticus]
MAEAVGLAASIIQIAGAGAKLSTTLYQFVSSAARADQEINDIAGDVQVTASALESVGEVFGNENASCVVSKRAIQDANSLIKRCETVFTDIHELIDKRRKVCKDGKKSLSTLGKFAWPHKEQKVQLLRGRLESLKTSLNLLFNVLHLANAQAKGQLEKSALDEEREKIRHLHQRQQESMKNLQALESKMHSVNLDDDDAATLQGSTAPSRVPTVEFAVHSSEFLANEAKDPEQNRSSSAKTLKNASPELDDSETSDSDATVGNDDDEHLTAEDLDACARHVQKLLKKISTLQQDFEAEQSTRRYPKRRVHKIYRRFCHKFETNILAQAERVKRPTIPLPQFRPLRIPNPQAESVGIRHGRTQKSHQTGGIQAASVEIPETPKSLEVGKVNQLLPNLENSEPATLSFGLKSPDILDSFDFDAFLHGDTDMSFVEDDSLPQRIPIKSPPGDNKPNVLYDKEHLKRIVEYQTSILNNMNCRVKKKDLQIKRAAQRAKVPEDPTSTFPNLLPPMKVPSPPLGPDVPTASPSLPEVDELSPYADMLKGELERSHTIIQSAQWKRMIAEMRALGPCGTCKKQQQKCNPFHHPPIKRFYPGPSIEGLQYSLNSSDTQVQPLERPNSMQQGFSNHSRRHTLRLQEPDRSIHTVGEGSVSSSFSHLGQFPTLLNPPGSGNNRHTDSITFGSSFGKQQTAIITPNPRSVSSMPDPMAAAPTKGIPIAFPDSVRENSALAQSTTKGHTSERTLRVGGRALDSRLDLEKARAAHDMRGVFGFSMSSDNPDQQEGGIDFEELGKDRTTSVMGSKTATTVVGNPGQSGDGTKASPTLHQGGGFPGSDRPWLGHHSPGGFDQKFPMSRPATAGSQSPSLDKDGRRLQQASEDLPAEARNSMSPNLIQPSISREVWRDFTDVIQKQVEKDEEKTAGAIATPIYGDGLQLEPKPGFQRQLQRGGGFLRGKGDLGTYSDLEHIKPGYQPAFDPEFFSQGQSGDGGGMHKGSMGIPQHQQTQMQIDALELWQRLKLMGTFPPTDDLAEQHRQQQGVLASLMRNAEVRAQYERTQQLQASRPSGNDADGQENAPIVPQTFGHGQPAGFRFACTAARPVSAEQPLDPPIPIVRDTPQSPRNQQKTISIKDDNTLPALAEILQTDSKTVTPTPGPDHLLSFLRSSSGHIETRNENHTDGEKKDESQHTGEAISSADVDMDREDVDTDQEDVDAEGEDVESPSHAPSQTQEPNFSRVPISEMLNNETDVAERHTKHDALPSLSSILPKSVLQSTPPEEKSVGAPFVPIPPGYGTAKQTSVAQSYVHRNACASARFRSRRKEKEKEAAKSINRLEQMVKELQAQLVEKEEKNKNAAEKAGEEEESTEQEQKGLASQSAPMELDVSSPESTSDEITKRPKRNKSKMVAMDIDAEVGDDMSDTQIEEAQMQELDKVDKNSESPETREEHIQPTEQETDEEPCESTDSTPHCRDPKLKNNGKSRPAPPITPASLMTFSAPRPKLSSLDGDTTSFCQTGVQKPADVIMWSGCPDPSSPERKRRSESVSAGGVPDAPSKRPKMVQEGMIITAPAPPSVVGVEHDDSNARKSPEAQSSSIKPVGTGAKRSLHGAFSSLPLHKVFLGLNKPPRSMGTHIAPACVTCKRAHLSCDTQRPCGRCVASGTQDSCRDVHHKKRGRPRLRDDGNLPSVSPAPATEDTLPTEISEAEGSPKYGTTDEDEDGQRAHRHKRCRAGGARQLTAGPLASATYTGSSHSEGYKRGRELIAFSQQNEALRGRMEPMPITSGWPASAVGAGIGSPGPQDSSLRALRRSNYVRDPRLYMWCDDRDEPKSKVDEDQGFGSKTSIPASERRRTKPRLLSPAQEATLHTWEVVEYPRDAKTTTSSGSSEKLESAEKEKAEESESEPDIVDVLLAQWTVDPILWVQ